MGSLTLYSPSLKRRLPLNVNQRLFPPNEFDNCIRDDYQTWREIQCRGGLQNVCPGMPYWVTPPWIKMPLQGKRFSEGIAAGQVLPLPANDGLDHLVFQFKVPSGFDGVGVSVIFNYTGQGFNEGSGDLTWRLKLNLHYVKDYGNVQCQIGSLITPYNVNSGQILLKSDQLVQFYINRSVASGGTLIGGSIIAALFGWYYPR